MVPCASNPCHLHGGSDVYATSIEEAEALANGQEDGFGLSSEKSGVVQQPTSQRTSSPKSISDATYEESDASAPVRPDVAGFISKNITSDGYIASSNGALPTSQLNDMFVISTTSLSQEEQSSLMEVATNKDFLESATKEVDDTKLPAATESMRMLIDNQSTSKSNIHDIVSTVTSSPHKKNLARQVDISSLANRDMSATDSESLYSAYPEQCMKAQRFNAAIVNRAITNPSTPERIRAIAVTNPQANADAVRDALRGDDDVIKAQAMLNPNGAYLDALHGDMASSLPTDEDTPFTADEIKSADKAFAAMKKKVASMA